MQNKAARITLQCPYRTNINKMHHKLEWLKVEDRWKMILTRLIKNTYEHKYPTDLFNQLEQVKVRETNITRYTTKHYFRLPRAKTNYMCRTDRKSVV